MSTIENTPRAGRSQRPAEVKVWDIAIRSFHWSLVISYVLVWVSADEWDRLHELAGYVIGGLIGFRLIWGMVGSKHARFSDFIYKPSAVYFYLRDSLFHRAKRYLGHNPAGGAMIIALLLSLIAATISGIAMTTNTFWGSEWVEELHEITANLTLVLVILHLAGVVYSSVAHGENLVRSMISGFKRH